GDDRLGRTVRDDGQPMSVDTVVVRPAPDPHALAERTKRRALRRLLRRPPAVVGLIVVMLFVVVAATAPLLAPYSPSRPDFLAVRPAPSAEYRLVTDESGRSVLTRVVFGGRARLIEGFMSVAIDMGVGVPLGRLAGYYRGASDELIMRVTDAVLAFPFLILAIAMAAALGPSLTNAMIAIGIASTPTFVRLTRAQVLAVVSEE